jgi:formylglycine-generating enzyme required for sulfatase activity
MTIPSQLLRGGSWINNRRICRSAYRNRFQPGNACDDIGFRVVCSPQEQPPPPVQLRGGSWYDYPRSCRSAYRDSIEQPDYAGDSIGFRVVCLPQEVAP